MPLISPQTRAHPEVAALVLAVALIVLVAVARRRS